MKFLIDAHLPSSLSKIFIESGFDCIHTLYLPDKNFTSDRTISSISISEKRIIITKDTDFFHSFLLKREPYKLVFVTVGNLKLKEVNLLFKDHFKDIISALQDHSMIELNLKGVKIII